MLAMSKNEVSEIDEQLNGKLRWAEQNTELAERLAIDITSLMSCTNDRLEDYKDKGFFKRCVSSFSGKTSKMQRDNQNDIVEMQKMGWRYLQMLNERDILMAHSLITIKNNLEILAVQEKETKDEITRFAIKVKEKFNSYTRRLDEVEVAVDIQQWMTTIEVQDYAELYPKHMRLLCLVRDFKSKKAQDWNMKNIHCLQQAIHNAKIDRKEKITLKQFVSNLIDEIEENSFEMFSEITTLNSYSLQKIDTAFLVEEIASPTFNSLYQISDNYTKSSIAVNALMKYTKDIEKKDAIKVVILEHIQSAGVDINKEIQLQDIALEILSCSKLAQELFEINHPNINNEIQNEIGLDDSKQIDYQENEASQSTENIEQLNTLLCLELSLMPKKFAVGDGFGVLIDNDGSIKSFGSNNYGCLGIGSNERDERSKPISVIDLPKDIQCVSIDVGYRHSLALLENGNVYGWGYSLYGQLGDDTEDDKLSPFKVIGLPKEIQPVKIVAGADSSVVLLENGDLYATGKIVDSLVFVPYPLDFKVQDIEFLYDRADNGLVLLKDDNKVLIKNLSENLDWCNFDKNDFCQLKGLPEDSIVKKIITGSNYLFVLTENNTLYGIGQNKDGQLGINERYDSVKSFSKIYGLEGEILQVSTPNEKSYWGNNEQHFTLIMTDSYIYGCGTNVKFQLGKQKNCYETFSEKDKSYAKNMAIGATAGALGGIVGGGIGAIIGAAKTAIEDTEYEPTEHYAEIKPKIIEELSDLINNTDTIQIACGNHTSYVYNFSTSKIYKMGGNNSNSDVEILDIKS